MAFASTLLALTISLVAGFEQYSGNGECKFYHLLLFVFLFYTVLFITLVNARCTILCKRDLVFFFLYLYFLLMQRP